MKKELKEIRDLGYSIDIKASKCRDILEKAEESGINAYELENIDDSLCDILDAVGYLHHDIESVLNKI